MTTTMEEPIRPAGWWYGVGGGLIAVGVIAAIVIFVVAFQDTFEEFNEIQDEIDAFQRVPAPGEGTVDLPRSGEFTVYVEGSTITVDDVVEEPTMTIESTEPDSQPLTLTPVVGEFTYDFEGPAVRSVFNFEAPEAGTYQVEVTDVEPGITSVAIGDDVNIFGAVGSIFVAILVPMGVGGVLGIAGIVVMIVTGVRRSNAQRRRRQAGTTGGWGQPAPQSQPWPPPSSDWPPPPPPPAPPS